MAKTSGRLSADKVENIISDLSTKNLRTLFFDKYGPVMDKLLSREDVLEGLRIKTDKMNALELKGLYSLLGLALHNLKKFTQKKGFNWVEITVSGGKQGRKYVYYGFTNDIDQINSNIIRFEKYVDSYKRIAKKTKLLGESQKKYLEGKATTA